MTSSSTEQPGAQKASHLTVENDLSKSFKSSTHSERPLSPSAFSDITSSDAGLPVQNGKNRIPITPQKGPRSSLNTFWIRNKGLVYVTASQVFNCLMNVTITILEVEGNNGKGFHPLQVLAVRMGITVILASAYMYHTKIPDFPLGAKGIRWLLVIRGFGGFFGVSAMYYSLMYLPLADATVITFLSPVIACAVCAYLLKEPFTRMEQIASVISLSGVILIARPTAIFSYFQGTTEPAETLENISSLNSTIQMETTVANHVVTSHQKVIAVGVALVGVVGGAVVITTLRSIGNRAHPLITVNYFATWVTIVSVISCAVFPSIGFAVPTNLTEWGYLIFLGFCGFTSQTLGAAGLQYEKSSRATNMIYTQMLFALIMDQLIFGRSPELLSIIGSALILGSAICIAFKQKAGKIPAEKAENRTIVTDEEVGLMEDQPEDSDEIAMTELRR